MYQFVWFCYGVTIQYCESTVKPNPLLLVISISLIFTDHITKILGKYNMKTILKPNVCQQSILSVTGSALVKHTIVLTQLKARNNSGKHVEVTFSVNQYNIKKTIELSQVTSIEVHRKKKKILHSINQFIYLHLQGKSRNEYISCEHKHKI